MLKAIRKFVLPGVLMAGLALIALPGQQISRAQDGLSDDEKALFDRVYRATDMIETFENYHVDIASNDNQAFGLTIAGQSQQIARNKTLTEAREIIAGEAEDGSQDNVQSQITLTFSESGLAGDSGYTMLADLRFIEGVLYLNAQYSDASDNIAPLSEGWQAFTSLEEIPGVFDELSFDDFFDTDTSDPLEDRELLESVTSSIISQSFETEDGTPVDVIIITIDEGFSTFYSEIVTEEEIANNPFIGVFTSDIADGTIIYSLVVDENDMPISLTLAFELIIPEFDASTVSDEFPPNTLLSIDFNSTETRTLSDINGDREPAVVPEIG